MGIQVEFNPDLALRNISEYKNNNRSLEECIPETLKPGKSYEFLKKGQRNYWLEGEIPLLETKGNSNLSRPKASIQIIEATHFMKELDKEPDKTQYKKSNNNNSEIYTKGKYVVIEVFDDSDSKINFEGFERIK
ncbi:hypothetical protein HOK51_09260 [Candidatus Woesearchaeota archaeon]|jgi:hypothetical protein|nr:hypothetical protein [Candidatus Woesearchaeota archaeon]MBT6520018.1 hypothetical protein [Candidatus Woesearchaeota archaeon]MBT7367735.1 hypothetical protein [Candidatus Woesearchaeota archaeon]